jgi:hypothetical protein
MSELHLVPAADPAGVRDTLFLVGGAALLVVGAGLILSSDMVRKYLGQVSVGDLVQAAVPDVERYFRLRAM